LRRAFPCQDLSQAGRTQGMDGDQSALVSHVFRLIKRKRGPRWLLLENVPFMLQLGRGAAMRYITDALDTLGYRWAYRVVDARAFGLPQRRQRVLLLASRTEDPREVLFADEADPQVHEPADAYPCGFYWTEGLRGLGWAVNAVPTLKGGSTLGIASPPAVRMPSGEIVVPGITDAERLQGFDADWTTLDVDGPRVRDGHRWKLVGNAVNTRMSSWVGERLCVPTPYDDSHDMELSRTDRWPSAAWGKNGRAYRTEISQWPVNDPYEDLSGYLEHSRLLSRRATAGFLSRTQRSTLRFPPGFLETVGQHLERMKSEEV
jgi:DNA (cytosine-5)-methyltransferase 1